MVQRGQGTGEDGEEEGDGDGEDEVAGESKEGGEDTIGSGTGRVMMRVEREEESEICCKGNCYSWNVASQE